MVLQTPLEDGSNPHWNLASHHLGEGERLVWVGRPIPRLIARRYLTPVRVGFGLLVLAGAVLLADSQLTNGQSVGIVTIGIGLFGLWRASTPLRWAFVSRREVYAVTDQRVFVARSLLRTRVRNYYPHHIEYVHLKERSAEHGSVVFDQRRVRDGAPFRLDDTPLDLGFLETTGARQAERAILDLLRTFPRTGA
ncbi:MAG: hypothetical protein O3A21_07095 [Proteobacteria bacterium]|nr:hypothetical protein [Pseudomonadota bacterium]